MYNRNQHSKRGLPPSPLILPTIPKETQELHISNADLQDLVKSKEDVKLTLDDWFNIIHEYFSPISRDIEKSVAINDIKIVAEKAWLMKTFPPPDMSEDDWKAEIEARFAIKEHLKLRPFFEKEERKFDKIWDAGPNRIPTPEPPATPSPVKEPVYDGPDDDYGKNIFNVRNEALPVDVKKGTVTKLKRWVAEKHSKLAGTTLPPEPRPFRVSAEREKPKSSVSMEMAGDSVWIPKDKWYAV